MAEDPDDNAPALFEHGPLRVMIQFAGWLGEQPAFFMAAEAPGGRMAEARLASSSPLYSEAVLWLVKDMRRLLRLGVAQYVKVAMMREARKSVQEREEKTREASTLMEVAAYVTDPVLAQAEEKLKEDVKHERTRLEKMMRAAAEEETETQPGLPPEGKRKSSMQGVVV